MDIIRYGLDKVLGACIFWLLARTILQNMRAFYLSHLECHQLHCTNQDINNCGRYGIDKVLGAFSWLLSPDYEGTLSELGDQES